MRDNGIWHAELVRLLTDLRHHDTLVIADAGLPVPTDVATVDLGWRRGEPRVQDVLAAVLGELVVEGVSLAKELQGLDHLADIHGTLAGLPVSWVSHEELKALTAETRAVVRTGDDQPYINVVLYAGVPFRSEP